MKNASSIVTNGFRFGFRFHPVLDAASCPRPVVFHRWPNLFLVELETPFDNPMCILPTIHVGKFNQLGSPGRWIVFLALARTHIAHETKGIGCTRFTVIAFKQRCCLCTRHFVIAMIPCWLFVQWSRGPLSGPSTCCTRCSASPSSSASPFTNRALLSCPSSGCASCAHMRLWSLS